MGLFLYRLLQRFLLTFYTFSLDSNGASRSKFVVSLLFPGEAVASVQLSMEPSISCYYAVHVVRNVTSVVSVCVDVCTQKRKRQDSRQNTILFYLKELDFGFSFSTILATKDRFEPE